MNTNTIFRSGGMLMILFSVVSIFASVLISCSEDDELSGEPYFIIEDAPTGLSVGAGAITKSYVVRSNRPWQVVAQEESDWVKAFPAEGSEDGIFKIIVEANPTFDARTMNFAFRVNGEEQPVLFRVEQEENVPYITVAEAESGVSVAAAEGEVIINVDANVDWTYTLDDNSWLTEQAVSETKIRLLAARNTGGERSVKLTVSSPQYPALSQEVVITQLPGNILLKEDFSWLNYGNTIPYETSGEKRFDTWTQEEKDRGWYSTPVAISSNQQIVYARPGFVKLGKTGVGGDLISPKLAIDGTATINVTFKAAAYISAGGAVDDNILKVYAVGAGTTSVAQFAIDNVPNSRAQDEAGEVNDIWAEDRVYSFTITGATSETQVRFLGGDFDLSGVGQGKNRIFLDDIKVEIIE